MGREADDNQDNRGYALIYLRPGTKELLRTLALRNGHSLVEELDAIVQVASVSDLKGGESRRTKGD